jgi:hypothetical protein
LALSILLSVYFRKFDKQVTWFGESI